MKKFLILILNYFTAYVEGQSTRSLDYQEDLRNFPDTLIDFFPDTLGKKSLTIKGVDTTSQCIFYVF
ncbi:MAG: hypothetical protein QM653_01845 [Dysgonomonas sp.]|uniref:hypothetical protein n=1 Tax=Dysgonomonas sp. TaxID=1891233 RepID=UPI0039E54D07